MHCCKCLGTRGKAGSCPAQPQPLLLTYPAQCCKIQIGPLAASFPTATQLQAFLLGHLGALQSFVSWPYAFPLLKADINQMRHWTPLSSHSQKSKRVDKAWCRELFAGM